jgi:dethiobiotin synthetase
VTPGVFITGTDTGVGKTRVAVGLLTALRRAGVRAVGMKPVAAGADRIGGRLRNDDAQRLLTAGAVAAPYDDVNPYCFRAAVSPHIAAARDGVVPRLDRIGAACARLRAAAEFVVVEGAGGWLAPISSRRTMADVATTCGFPVLLVVGLRLGCLNHAALTARAIAAQGNRLIGWVGSAVDPDFQAARENLATLAAWLPAPQLGLLPHTPSSARDGARLAGLAAALRPGRTLSERRRNL